MQANQSIYDPPPPYAQVVHQPLPSGYNYGATGGGYDYRVPGGTTVVITAPNPAETIVLVGGCPACRVGVLEDEFTFLGLLCFILFFPIGIICCMAFRQRRCLNCGAVF